MRADPAMLGASGFERIDLDAYFTVDPVCLEALLQALPLDKGDRILEPAAGRGHLAKGLREAGFEVEASDVFAHADPLIDDIETGRDILKMDTVAGYSAIITNLPYDAQDRILEHLLPIAIRDGAMVAILTRAPWHIARKRRALVHQHAHFQGVVMLPRRPWWSDDRRAAPRHEFCWNVWSAEPRETSRPSIFYPEWRAE